MDPHTSPRPRKRRAINACVNCRTSKVRCDGKRPCARCEKNRVSCDYFDAVKDENLIRIEKLEAEMASMREHINRVDTNAVNAESMTVSTHLREPSSHTATSQISLGSTTCSTANAVDAGLITWEQATHWFRRYVLLHCPKTSLC